MPLPGYSPDLMPVEELWRWLREDVTDHHCHASADDLTRRVADFEGRLNREPFVIADRLWVKDTSTQRRRNCASQSRRGLSAGGNDLLGEGRLASYLRDGNRPVAQYLKPAFFA